MLEVPFERLLWDSDVVGVVRPVASHGTVPAFQVVEVLRGELDGERIAIRQTDFHQATGAYEPPEPGMHVSYARWFYPGTGDASAPEGHIAFLKRLPAGGELVYAVSGACEPVAKRDEIVATIARGRSWPAPANPTPAPAEPRLTWWQKLLRRF